MCTGIWHQVHNEKKNFWEKDKFSMKKQFEEIMVTHRESMSNSRKKTYFEQNPILHMTLLKMYIFKQFIQKNNT